jgi:hypothetical protein
MSLRERTAPGWGSSSSVCHLPKAPPSGPGWLHEIKHDGFRIPARRDGAGNLQLTVFDAKKRSHTAIEQPIASTKRPG